MRVANWAPENITAEIEKKAMGRLREAAYILKDETVRKLRSQIGVGYGKGPFVTKKGKPIKRFNISRGPYKTGAAAGEPWTARHAGDLLKTIRVTERLEEYGATVGTIGNYRVYAGNYLVWWAKIFEYYKPYLRVALAATRSKIKSKVENG